MKFVITAIALALAVAAPAGATQPPRAHAMYVMHAKVCGKPILIHGGFRLPPSNVAATVDGFVNGHRLRGATMGADLYLFGASTIVQAPIDGRQPIFRAVRTMPRCAHLRLVIEW